MLTDDERIKLESEDPYWFEELFYHDLESWFSSDIACCDECYDDFLKYWPHVYSADKAAFQCNSISLDCFYSGSRLSESYTEEEFYKYLKLVPCPRCGSELRYNIWPYNFPFDLVDDFENKITEIVNIAQSTPFMLMEHPFAKELYLAIKDLSIASVPSLITSPLYRARTKESLQSASISEFDFPPKEFVSEGRYNHAGVPALYLASDPATCFFEMRESPSIIAEINITKEVKILDLVTPYESHRKHDDLLSTLTYSALISARQSNTGWYRPMYIFSRFISDCAKYSGFDAIKYPSTRTSNDNDSYNLVILNNELSLQNSSTVSRLMGYTKDGEENILQ